MGVAVAVGLGVTVGVGVHVEVAIGVGVGGWYSMTSRGYWLLEHPADRQSFDQNPRSRDPELTLPANPRLTLPS
jgi:hypothetical protein